MNLVEVNWHPSSRKLRQYGIVMIVGFGLIGLLFRYGFKATDASWVIWGFGAVSGVLGLTGTRAALPLYWLWMGIGFVMGNVMNRLLLALVFYLVVTPMALVMKLVKRDRLHIKPQQTDSYWIDVPPVSGANPYERQS